MSLDTASEEKEKIEVSAVAGERQSLMRGVLKGCNKSPLIQSSIVC